MIAFAISIYIIVYAIGNALIDDICIDSMSRQVIQKIFKRLLSQKFAHSQYIRRAVLRLCGEAHVVYILLGF